MTQSVRLTARCIAVIEFPRFEIENIAADVYRVPDFNSLTCGIHGLKFHRHSPSSALVPPAPLRAARPIATPVPIVPA